MVYTKLKKNHLLRDHIHKATSSEYLRVLILRTVGNFLLLSSLFMIGKTFYQPAREEIRYFIDGLANKKYYVTDVKNISKITQEQTKSLQVSKKGLLARALKIKPVEYITPEDANFSLVVPKIAANARILSNIDASNEKEYLDALEEGVAHAQGTAFPGEGGHIFLFAHSTDYFWNVGNYNAVFYLLSKLEKGDEINLFYKKQRYIYKVTGKTIVDPSQVEYLTRKSNKELLTLQTCWPPGTTLKRLLVFANRIVE